MAIIGSKHGKNNQYVDPEEKGQGFTVVCNDCGAGDVYIRADPALDYEPIGVLVWCTKCNQRCRMG